MHEIIISDTSCLILLEKINYLEILHKLYQKVYITPEIKEEYGNPLPDWILIKPVKDTKLFQSVIH